MKVKRLGGLFKNLKKEKKAKGPTPFGTVEEYGEITVSNESEAWMRSEAVISVNPAVLITIRMASSAPILLASVQSVSVQRNPSLGGQNEFLLRSGWLPGRLRVSA